MKEKRDWKTEIKETWDDNKGKISIGLKCLGIGLVIGFIKGA